VVLEEQCPHPRRSYGRRIRLEDAADCGAQNSLSIFRGLNLLLLLEGRLAFSKVLIPIRQPQPDFRHV
jgi:hypothetical protein